MQLALIGIAADFGRLGGGIATACVRDDVRSAAQRADYRARDAALRIVQRAADRLGEFPRLAAELPVAPAGLGRKLRDLYRDEDLALFEHGAEKPGHELVERHLAVLLRALEDCETAEERESARPVGRRIGVRQAAAERAAVAHRAVGDARSNVA